MFCNTRYYCCWGGDLASGEPGLCSDCAWVIRLKNSNRLAGSAKPWRSPVLVFSNEARHTGCPALLTCHKRSIKET